MTLVCAACMSFVTSAGAQIYKWVDERGVTHYDSAPPAGRAPGHSQTLDIPVTSSSPMATSSGNWQDKDSAFQRRYDQRKAQEAKDEAAAKTALARRQHTCMYARDELNGVLAAGAVYHLDAQGNRIYLNEQQRTQHISELRQKMADNCNG